MGAAFDAHGSYAYPLIVFCIAVLAAAALMMVVGPYRYGAASIVDARLDEDALESPLQA
jgi:hypothetical protein